MENPAESRLYFFFNARDLRLLQQVRQHVFEALPSRVFLALALCHPKLQIFKAVIGADTVLVVNVFSPLQRTPKFPLHYKSVLNDPFATLCLLCQVSAARRPDGPYW